MISQQQIKYIHSLEQKKYRKIHRKFVVEGEKMVEELVKSSFTIDSLFATKSFLKHLPYSLPSSVPVFQITDEELKKISQQQTPNEALALVSLPEESALPVLKDSLYLALDCIQDPGNLGTIIRTAAWFGVKHIFCSPDTVDVFNPKVIQATMGAIFKVQLHYTPLVPLIETAKQQGIFSMGALLTGNNMYESRFPEKALLVMGNESKGISGTLQQVVEQKIRIPAFPEEATEVESLNVSIATALICAEFRRKQVTPHVL